MGFINKEELLDGLKNKKFCKFCVYANKEAKCLYPNEAGCSPAAMISAIAQFIESLDVENEFRTEVKYTNEPLKYNYVAMLQRALEESINKDPEKAKEELISMGVLNKDGTPKEKIVDNV